MLSQSPQQIISVFSSRREVHFIFPRNQKWPNLPSFYHPIFKQKTSKKQEWKGEWISFLPNSERGWKQGDRNIKLHESNCMNVYKITCIKLKTVTCFWYTLFKNVLFWKLCHKCTYWILNELNFPPLFYKWCYTTLNLVELALCVRIWDRKE